MKNFSIKNKLLLSFLLLSLLILPVSYYTIKSSHEIKMNFFDIIELAFPRIQALLEMKTNAVMVTALINDFNPDIKYSSREISDNKDSLLAALEEMNRWQKRYRNHLGYTNNPVNLKEFTRLYDAVVFSALNAFAESENRTNKSKILASKNDLMKNQLALNNFIKKLIVEENTNLEESKRNVSIVMDRVDRIIILTNLSMILLAILISLSLAHIISRPIIKLRDFAHFISQENLNKKVSIESNDEIGELATSLNDMLTKLGQAKSELIAVSRQAGKAEVSTSILHNVGNILNSISVSVALFKEGNAHAKLDNLMLTLELIKKNLGGLDDYLLNDEKGKLIIPYLTQLHNQLMIEKNNFKSEVESLSSHLEDVKKIIDMQQDYAKISDVQEDINLNELLENVLTLFISKIERYNITVDKQCANELYIHTVKSKLHQILVNLIKNAIESVSEQGLQNKILRMKVEVVDQDYIKIDVQDNGVGISKESLSKIFSFGFTTKQNGHGYGLHNCAFLTKELGGKFSVSSSGEGKGALFSLTIPIRKT